MRPARRARQEIQRQLRRIEDVVARAEVDSIDALAYFNKDKILSLQGVGIAALRAVRAALAERGKGLVGERRPPKNLQRRTPELVLSGSFEHALMQSRAEAKRDPAQGQGCLYCGHPGAKLYALPSGASARLHDECLAPGKELARKVSLGEAKSEDLPSLGSLTFDRPKARAAVDVPPWALRQGAARERG